jgi:plastocyanin domain-containing protein
MSDERLSGLFPLTLLLMAACGGTKSDSTPSSGNKAVTVDRRGFTPSSLTLERGDGGSTATVTFTRTTDDTCARWVVIPGLQRNIHLPLNKPVDVTFPTDPPRTLAFQCGTGFYKGSLVVQ